MIHPHSVDQPFAIQVEEEAVGQREHGRILYPHTRQLVDREKAPPVQPVVRTPPVYQPVMLAIQQSMERHSPLRRRGIVTGEGEVARLSHCRIIGADRIDRAAMNLKA